MIPLNVSKIMKIDNVVDSDSDDAGMKSGFMTPPRKNEMVISIQKDDDINGELEAYLQQNKSGQIVKLDQIPGSE